MHTYLKYHYALCILIASLVHSHMVIPSLYAAYFTHAVNHCLRIVLLNCAYVKSTNDLEDSLRKSRFFRMVVSTFSSAISCPGPFRSNRRLERNAGHIAFIIIIPLMLTPCTSTGHYALCKKENYYYY